MSDTVIKIENLSKKYTIRHQQPEHYSTLRDTIITNTKQFLNKFSTSSDSKFQKQEEFWALKDINLEIRRGEKVGIVGKNGAGKSTLLKILSRITEPTSGSIKIKGRIASLLEVGTGFHPELTGRENIFLNGAILGMTKNEIRQKFDEIVDFSGVEKFLDTPVKRYSSGMYVRLAFSVAAHLESEILLIDEVLAVGDAEFQKKCLGKMDDVSREGKTILFVSHNMAALSKFCQKGVILNRGKIQESEDIDKIISSYFSTNNIQRNQDRKGYITINNSKNKNKIFHKIRLIDENNNYSTTFRAFSSMEIEILVKNNETYPEADYCIAIINSLGHRITSYATWMYKKDNNLIPSKIDVKIDKLNFAPGNYHIHLNSTLHVEGVYLDKVDCAASFEVVAYDILESGEDFKPNSGLILPEGTLKLI